MTINHPRWLWLAALTFAVFTPAQASLLGDVGATHVAYDTTSQVEVMLDVGGWTGSAYDLCWKKASQPSNPCFYNDVPYSAAAISSSSPNHPNAALSGLTLGTTYVIGGRCKCSNDASWSHIAVWRQVAATTYVFVTPPPPGPTVRLRSEQTGQCAYLYQGTGYHWGCWTDPNMRFQLLTVSPNVYAFKHTNSGSCMAAPSIVSGVIVAGTCGGSTSLVAKTDIGGGRFQLHWLHAGPPIFQGDGGCLYIQGGNGGLLLRAPCTTDPKFAFYLDPA